MTHKIVAPCSLKMYPGTERLSLRSFPSIRVCEHGQIFQGRGTVENQLIVHCSLQIQQNSIQLSPMLVRGTALETSKITYRSTNVGPRSNRQVHKTSDKFFVWFLGDLLIIVTFQQLHVWLYRNRWQLFIPKSSNIFRTYWCWSMVITSFAR